MDQKIIKKGAHRTEHQKELLAEFLKKHPQILSGKFSQNFTYKDYVRKWEEISDILNGIPGAKKNWKGWRKTWQDTRSRTKKKISDGNVSSRTTGGGRGNMPELNVSDRAVLELIKTVSVLGEQSVSESTVNLNLEKTNLFDPPIIDHIRNPENGPEAGVLTEDLHLRKDNESESQVDIFENDARDAQNVKPSPSGLLPRKISKASEIAAAVTHFRSVTTEQNEIKKEYYDAKLKLMKDYQREKLKRMDDSLEVEKQKCQAINRLITAVENLVDL